MGQTLTVTEGLINVDVINVTLVTQDVDVEVRRINTIIRILMTSTIFCFILRLQLDEVS